MGTLVQERTYKTSLINNRRYLRNKYKLLSFIKGVVEKECNNLLLIFLRGQARFLLPLAMTKL